MLSKQKKKTYNIFISYFYFMYYPSIQTCFLLITIKWICKEDLKVDNDNQTNTGLDLSTYIYDNDMQDLWQKYAIWYWLTQLILTLCK